MTDKTRVFDEKLIQHRDARDVLTEQEYIADRTATLDELATFVYVPL